MPDQLINVFDDDAFSMVTLTSAVNELDFVPGLATSVFRGVGRGVPSTRIAIERRSTGLAIIPTSPRGAPAPQEVQDKASMFDLTIPHIVLEQTISAASVQDRRGFGTSALASAQTVINDAMAKMSGRMDLTVEHMCLGALQGKILDADGSTIVDLFDAFDVSPPATVTFSNTANSLRPTCLALKRDIERAAKVVLPAGATVKAFCSASFFDSVTGHPDATAAYANWEAAAQNLAGDNRAGWTFGGIEFAEYRGSDDVIPGEEPSDASLIGKVGIPDGEAIFFIDGVPALYDFVAAPADWFSAVNEVGLPRYAAVVQDDNLARWVKLHVQSNPLPLCLRPATLTKGSF